MKIIAVFHDNDIQSGGTLSYLSVIEYLRQEGNEIVGIIPNKTGKLEEYINSLGIETIRCFYGGNIYYAKSTGKKKIKGIMKCFAKSIVSVFSAFLVAYKLKDRHCELIYTNTSTINIGFWISRFLKAKHIWHFREFCLEDQDSLRLFDRGFAKKASKTTKIITISNSLNEYYKKKYSLSNTVMLYDDLSTKYITDSHKLYDKKIINILVTGTFSEGKGQEIALKAIEKLSNPCVHLYFAGRINLYAKKLIDYVEKNGVKNIHFCGLIQNMNELRKEMDFSIVCSRSEAFGRTIIEDMLAGVLVIGANSGSVSELIKDKYNGLVYRHGDIDDLCKVIDYAIGTLCDRDFIINSEFQFAINFIRNNTAKAINTLMRELLKKE